MAKEKTPEWLKYNGDGSVDITLSRPANIGGVEQSVIRMREPTVADSEAANELKGSDAAREIQSFANLCDVSPDDLRKLPMRDFLRMQKAYMGFID